MKKLLWICLVIFVGLTTSAFAGQYVPDPNRPAVFTPINPGGTVTGNGSTEAKVTNSQSSQGNTDTYKCAIWASAWAPSNSTSSRVVEGTWEAWYIWQGDGNPSGVLTINEGYFLNASGGQGDSVTARAMFRMYWDQAGGWGVTESFPPGGQVQDGSTSTQTYDQTSIWIRSRVRIEVRSEAPKHGPGAPGARTGKQPGIGEFTDSTPDKAYFTMAFKRS